MRKKVNNKKWCPLTGDIGFPNDLYFKLIERTRELWGSKHIGRRNPDGSYITHCYMPSDAAFEKAREIYEAWMNLRQEEYQRGKLEILCNVDAELRPSYIEDMVLTVCGFKKPYSYTKFTVFEVLTIIAITEAKENMEKGINNALPFELIEIAKNYSPDAILGQKVIEGGRTSGKARRAQVVFDRFEVWKNWQKEADNIWKRDLTQSKSKRAVAISIKKNLGCKDSINTIRQKIKKPNMKDT